MTHEIEEGRIAGELVGKIAEIVGVPPVFAANLLSQEVLLSAVRKLASQSAPSGWQQRIAAITDPYKPDVGLPGFFSCFFCGRLYGCAAHKPNCLWQNAVDALPPAPEVKEATHDWVSDTVGPSWCRHCGRNAGNAQHPCPRRWPDAKDAIPPGPEGVTIIGKDGQPLSDVEVDAFLASHPPSDPERVDRIRRKLEDKLREAREVGAPTTPSDLMANLFNAFADDVERMSDEDLIAEIVEDGGDPADIAEKTRRLLQDTIERFKAKQAAEADASPVKEERDDA